MAKQTGIAWSTLTVDDLAGTPRDIRSDLSNFDLSTPKEVQDVTGLDKEAMERLLLLADVSLNLSGYISDDLVSAHNVFKDVGGQRTTVVGFTAPAVSLTAELLYTDYKISRDNSGAVTFEAPGVLADGTLPAWV